MILNLNLIVLLSIGTISLKIIILRIKVYFQYYYCLNKNNYIFKNRKILEIISEINKN